MPKSEVDEFLGQVNGESKDEPKNDPFIDDESDPLATKEVEGTKVAKEDEGDKTGKPELPYHMDPKLQRYIEKEVGKRIKDIKVPEAPVAKAEAGTDDLTETLIEIIGNDTPQKVAAVKKFREQLGSLEERGAERALEQIRNQADAEAAEVQAAEEELVNAFERIEEENGVDITSNSTAARKERNEFIEFIKRVSPKDANGDVTQYPDMDEAWKVFTSNRKPTTDNKRAKDIASRSMARSTDSGGTPTTGKTWKDVDKIFSKL